MSGSQPWTLGRKLTSDLRRRWLGSFALAFASAFVLEGLFGLATAGDEVPAGLPETLALATPHVGDRGVYVHFRYALGPNGYEPIGRAEDFGRFEWLAPTDVYRPDGSPQRVNQVREWAERRDDGENSNLTREWVVAFLPGTLEPVLFAQRWKSDGYKPASGGSPLSGQTAEFNSSQNDVSLSGPRMEWASLRRCVYQPSIQGQTVDLRRPVQLFHGCNLVLRGVDWEASWLPAFRARAVDELQGRKAIVFETEGEGPSVLVWLAPDIPYPLQVAAEFVEEGETKLGVLALREFEAGHDSLADPEMPPSLPRLPPFEWAPRKPWGPDDTEIRHPFPLSTAFTYARDDPNASRLREFLASHPNAAVVSARYWEDAYPEGLYLINRTWKFWVSDATDRIKVGVSKTSSPERLVVAPLGASLPLLPIVIYSYDNESVMPFDAPTPQEGVALPERLPTLSSLERLWHQVRSSEFSGATANYWSFAATCQQRRQTPCQTPAYGISFGFFSNQHGGPSAPVSGSPEWTRLESYVHFDDQLLWTGLHESQTTRDDPPLVELPVLSDAHPPETLAPKRVDSDVAWRAPPAIFAAAAGVAALLVGLTYWFWPAVKSALPWRLYSRIEGPSVLDHPVRARMQEVVGAQPGIHFQEIARRLGLGQATAEHHLRKLVAGGVLSEHRGTGYTCYFAKGTVDRRIMEVAPLLKAPGARALMEAVRRQPKVRPSTVAAALGLTRQTLSYHSQRLERAGLLRLDRDGRTLKMDLTDLGRQALLLEGGAA